jgi:hypothetical protein
MDAVDQPANVTAPPYDNLATRVGVRLNIGQAYEHASVVGNKFEHGGVGNSPVPNIRFVHKMRVPWGQLRRAG